jgi:hypothetical protein
MIIASKTLKRLHTVMGSVGIKDTEVKADLVSVITLGRTKSTSKLFEDEAKAIINQLQLRINAEADKADVMRKKILAICHTMAWYQRDGNKELILKNGKPQLDFARINAFCSTRCPGKKPLQKYTAAELPAIVTIFERVLKGDLK